MEFVEAFFFQKSQLLFGICELDGESALVSSSEADLPALRNLFAVFEFCPHLGAARESFRREEHQLPVVTRAEAPVAHHASLNFTSKPSSSAITALWELHHSGRT